MGDALWGLEYAHPVCPARTHLLNVHVLQECTVGLQDWQGRLVIVFIVAAGALPALGLLNGDDLKWGKQAVKKGIFAFPSPAKKWPVTQLPLTGGVLAAEHELNQDFGEMANFNFNLRKKMQNLTQSSWSTYYVTTKVTGFPLLLLLLIAQSPSENYTITPQVSYIPLTFPKLFSFRLYLNLNC